MTDFKPAKRTVRVVKIKLLNGKPVIGQRCDIRLYTEDSITDIRTSPVVDWYEGYPNAIGGIVIETRNSVYSGNY